jgi:protein gp37
MGDTTIEWATKVWNPVTGCTKVSAGCKNCYAERIANRFWGERKFTDVQCHDERLCDPQQWKKPQRVFVNSMSDLFHPDVRDEFIDKVFWKMADCDRHTFIILTKRVTRMHQYIAGHVWGEPGRALPNVWLGVSAENQIEADRRIPILLQTPAAKRFVSIEPMLGEILLQGWSERWHLMRNYLDQGGIQDRQQRGPLGWVICGCESGPGARPFDLDWARVLRDQCQEASVPFFFKQARIDGKLIKQPELDGRQRLEFPGGGK